MGQVLAQPVAALGQRLRFAVDAANHLLLAVGKQIVVDFQPNFRADRQLRQAHEHVERVGDAPIGGVFQGHDAKIDVAAVHLLENGGDAADTHVLDVLPKPFDGGQMAITVFRAEISDFENLLQCPRAAHDLAKDGADGGFVERPLAGIQDVLEDLFFTGRVEDFRPLIVLDLADFRRQ